MIEFDQQYRPVPTNPTDPAIYLIQRIQNARYTLLTLGLDTTHLWSVVETDDESLYAVAGERHVNVIGFLVTEVPWVTGEEEICWL